MPLWKKLFGMGIVSLRDVGLGLLATYFLAVYFGEPATLVWYGLGVFFALLPDFDIMLQVGKSGSADSEHRQSVMHAPAVMIGGTLALCLWNPHVAVLGAICLFLHFLDDTVGDENAGAGIAWLWPLSGNLLVIFCKDNGQRSLFRWRKPAELQPVLLEVWLERFWLRPTKESVSSIAVFLAAIAVVLKGGLQWGF